MALIKYLQKEKISFMKLKDSQMVEVINEILTGAKTFAVNKKEPDVNKLTDDEIVSVIKRVQKQLVQEIEWKSNVKKSTEKELKQKEYVEQFIPKVKTKEETTKIIEDLVSKGFDFNGIMKELVPLKKELDMKFASTLARTLTSK